VVTKTQTGSQPTFTVRDDYARVPTRDGTHLHARLWRPMADEPLPVVINYDPYRSTDSRTQGRGDIFHYLARHGFILVHLSVRGTDASDGVAVDEYAPAEQADGYDAIEWFAAQPWCNGNVGMIGTSYSGFTCIQVAMHQPPHLKAIVPINATDDRYTDDVHYRGGALHTFDQVTTYGAAMPARNALPTLPEHAGDRWLDLWTEHLNGNPLWLATWLEHQTDGPYWRAASLRPGYDRIRCPVFICGGWQDAYRNATLRVFQHVSVPKKCIVGPWTHSFPDQGNPGPGVDFMGMVVRWFDHWLKGIDTGFTEEPALLVYVQEHTPPRPRRTSTPGFWRAEPGWPVPGAGEKAFYLGAEGGLRDAPSAEGGEERYEYRATVGTQNLGWGGCPWIGAPADQRPDEMYALVYTSPALTERTHVLGNPKAVIHFASTAPVVNLVCKLSDVAPDGSSALVTTGLLNVTHRASHERPEALTPGEVYEVTVELDATGYVFAAGHRIRLAVSSSDWPNTWPSPYPATNRVFYGGGRVSRLVLPVAPPKEADQAPEMPAPRMPTGIYAQEPGSTEWQVTRNVYNDRVTVAIRGGGGGRLSEALAFHTERSSVLTASDADPSAASCDSVTRLEMRMPHETVVSEGSLHFTSSREAFHLVYDLTVTLNGREHFRRVWRRSFPRRLV